MFNPDYIIAVLLNLMLIIPALVLHELAHGYVAYLLGDMTAKRMGRLTLNPLKHIDPFGTVLLPAIMFFSTTVLSSVTGLIGHGFAFGYAKPVPFNPNNFRDRRKGILLTGIAGPAMNVVLAVVSGLLCRLFSLLLGSGSIVPLLFQQFTYINLMFAFFNLIPIPPLDGSRVLQRFLPRSALHYYSQLERWGFMIILGIMLLFPGILSGYFNFTVVPLVRLISGGV